ncbi:RNA polymerase sigma-70 factor, ECF subfamily [Chitinophaga jiangningensis]|uniref:RNA polymerase sigma-70 factor, ECF subfamily n=1 Tax=Chitinophaga jiangningensis TaxID=1419482 RepID=A0A1M6WW65_9BACT|nr:sigma-70 family RNA polymerase sigma factor [Chitinophaga jiangningensis]SHK97963.1 RNA polymerase sigma-70 factor, ECF subfamily [Chitinophaga jiangningensis]
MEEIQQLVRDCLANNRLSQERLYRKFYPALFLLCRKFFNNPEEAVEVLNDGMLQVFTQLSKYDAEKGAFFNWAYTVVRNTALDRIRLRKWPESQELEEDVGSTQNNILSKLAWEDIYKLLDNLPPTTRAVCSLFYLEGFSIRDISDKLQQSPGTVKWHLSETRSKLKPILEQHYLK